MKNIDIISRLAALGIAPEVQNTYVTAAVARVIAYTAKLPAEPDEGFFQSQVAPYIAGQLDFFNESIPLDYPAITNLVRRLWEVRYDMVHPRDNQRHWAALDFVANEDGIDFGVLRTDPALTILTNELAGG